MLGVMTHLGGLHFEALVPVAAFFLTDLVLSRITAGAVGASLSPLSAGLVPVVTHAAHAYRRPAVEAA